MNGRKQELFDQFLIQLAKLKRCLEQRSQIPVGEKVATMLQAHALLFIKENPESTVSKLANNLALSSSAIAQLSDRLVESGWISRTHDDEDRRIVHLGLTAKGEEKLSDLKQNRKKDFADMANILSEEELETLVKIFTRLTDAAMQKEKKV